MKCQRLKGRRSELAEIIKKLGLRSKMDTAEVNQRVKEILTAVKSRGDQAILDYTETFDRVRLRSEELLVSQAEIEEAMAAVEPKVIKALEAAAENIRRFHQKQLEKDYFLKVGQNSRVGMLVRPLGTAGIYVPGGTAPLPSTVLMNVIPAQVAGVENIVVCTPPNGQGKIAPVILAAATIAGAHRIYKVGGAQAIAAMAYGTETIPEVDKICGPGNIYVNTAKRLLYGQVDIDMFAGPSEILIIADETAIPAFVAADLLSQSEHDPLASAILITTSLRLADQVTMELEGQCAKLQRQSILEKSLRDYCAIVEVESLEDGIVFANALAPEHLELCVKEPEAHLPMIKNAGAVFMGNYSPEPLGDYFAGPNHTLPTSGTARFFSPLGTYDFMKKMSVIDYSAEDLKDSWQTVVTLAEAEGLDGHANALRVRFESTGRSK